METETKIGGVVKIEVRELPEQEYLGKSFTSPLGSVGGAVQEGLASLYERIQMVGAVPAGPPFLIASQPLAGSMGIEVGVPCVAVPEPAPGQHRGKLAAGKGAAALYRGPYDQIGGVYSTLFEWTAEQGLRPAGAPREVYLNGPDEVAGPAEYLTEVILPIA